MDRKKTQAYKERLGKEKSEILKGIKDYSRPEDFGSDIDHYDEEADEAESTGLRLGLSQGLKDRLEDVEAALQKIKNGKYGVCEKCGQEIGEDVLKLTSASRLCKNCKKGTK